MKLSQKLLLAAGAMSLAIPAYAQDFNPKQPDLGLEFRVDFVSNNSDKDEDFYSEVANDEDKTTKFVFARNRINLKGKINETTSYRIRLRYDKAGSGTNSFDKTDEGLDKMYVTRKVNDNISITVGKNAPTILSMENDYSGMDQYHYSQTNGEALGGNTGVTVSADVADQTLVFELKNSGFDQDNQQTFAMNLAWYGNLMGGMITPIVSFSSIPSEKQESATEETDGFTASQYGIGTRVTLMDKLELEAEINNVTTPEYDVTTIDATTGVGTDATTYETKWDATILQARWRDKMFAPFVKFTQDSKDVDGEDVEDYTGTSAGVEVFLDGKGVKTYRVHAVFISESYANDANDDLDYTTTQFNVGVGTRF